MLIKIALKGKSREIWLPIFFTQLDREFNFKQLSNLFHQKIFTGNAWFFAFKVAFLGKIAWFCCCKLPRIEKFHATSHDNEEVIFHSSATKISQSVAVPFFKQVDILFYHSLKCVLVGAMWYKVHEKYTAGTFFDKLCGQKTTTSCENFLMKYITKSLLFGPRIHRKSKNRGSILTRLPL